MKLRVRKSIIGGVISAPASKSCMQRAIASALLADGETIIINPSNCDDALSSLAMAECLGAKIRQEDDRIFIKGGFVPACNELNCGESGLGLRMFSAIASLHSEPVKISGKGSILKRPVGISAETMNNLGVELRLNNGFLPLEIKGPLKGGISFLDGSVSSQFLTGLLIASPVISNNTQLIVSNLKSRQYIDLTLDVIRRFGIEIYNEDYTRFLIPGEQKYKAIEYEVEGDWSGAAFLLVMAAVYGKITVKNLSLMSTQPDRAIIEVLRRVGAKLDIKDNSVSVEHDKLESFDFDISECPDLAPPLVALAINCKGKSIIRGTERLRIKESDRASVLVREFSKLGVNINSDDNQIVIEGRSDIRSCELESHGDHRIAMALTLAGLGAEEGIIINSASSVKKSYPAFFDVMMHLGVNIEIIDRK